MKIDIATLEFEWDKGNSDKNYFKHEVTKQESEEVFINEPFIVLDDTAHSTEEEKRFQGLGRTSFNRKLFISFTIRSNKIRVISVRDMSKRERLIYEKIKKNS